MSAGSRSEPVTVERLSRVPDGAGGAVVSWSDLGLIWCDLKPVKASEKELSTQGGGLRAINVYLLTADALSVSSLGVTTADRVTWNGDPFGISEIRTGKASKQDVEIVVSTSLE